MDLIQRAAVFWASTNGNGCGGDEVSTYEVFLNGKRVLRGDPRHNQVRVKLRLHNSLKVVLMGDHRQGCPWRWLFFFFFPRMTN